MQTWLLVRGRGDRPLDARVDADRIRAHSSSKRPSVQCGDRAILYAAVWQAVFAVVEVVGDPEHDPERQRWSWRFAIRPLAAVADLHAAPAVEEVGVFPQSLWRHSHIRLTEQQFEAARALIEKIARRHTFATNPQPASTTSEASDAVTGARAGAPRSPAGRSVRRGQRSPRSGRRFG